MFTKLFSTTVYKALHIVKSLLASVIPSSISPRTPSLEPSGFLAITDSRTNRKYEIPIHRNAVEATSFKEIRAPKDDSHPADKSEWGLRVLDQGFQNTAVMTSRVTFVDGIEGSICYRGIPIPDLVGKAGFEDISFLLIWGYLPEQQEREKYRKALAAAMIPPQMVSDVLQSFP